MKRSGDARFVLSGYYGFGNLGDEAVLAGLLSAFGRRGYGPGCFTVLSADPERTRALHGVSAVHRTRLPDLLRALRGADLLISGGGSLLQDATSQRSLLYYLWIIRLARLLGTPAAVIAQGVGPLSRRSSRVLVRQVVNRVACITVRDGASAELLQRIGVRRPPVEVTADPAFALQGDEVAGQALLDAAGVTFDRPVVGVALRTWRDPQPSLAVYARAVEMVARRCDARAVYVPMQPPGDVDLGRRLAAVIPSMALLPESASSAAMLGAIGRLSGMVAMRLHALMFAAMSGVPVSGISYDPKVDAFLATIGEAERWTPLAEFRAETVAERMASALREREAERKRLLGVAADLAQRAERNVDRAIEAAGRTG